MSFKRSFIGIAVAVFAFAGVASGAGAVVVGTVPGSPFTVPNSSGFDTGELVTNPDGPLDPQNAGPGVDFIHEWQFEITGQTLALNPLTLQNTTTPASPLPQQNILGLKLTLFQDTDGDATNNSFIEGTNFGSTAVVDDFGTNPKVEILFANLVPDTYFFRIVGMTSGSVGGKYDVTLNFVPLPPAIWLLISALMGLVSFSRIRRTNKTATA